MQLRQERVPLLQLNRGDGAWNQDYATGQPVGGFGSRATLRRWTGHSGCYQLLAVVRAADVERVRGAAAAHGAQFFQLEPAELKAFWGLLMTRALR